MKTSIISILGISSILLGIYILSVYLLNPHAKVDYHLGCYLSDIQLDHSFTLKSKYQELKMSTDSNYQYANSVKSVKLIDTDLHKKSVQLSKNVQKYIQELVLTRQIQKNNMEFYNDLSKSRQNYEECAQKIKQNFHSQQCHNLWNDYKQCFQSFQKETFQLRSLYNKRDSLTRQIDSVLIYDPSNNKTLNIEYELRLIKQKYAKVNAENDQNKDKLISELKRVQHKHQTKLIEQDQSQRELNRTKLEYEICLKNLKQFKKCQNIAKALQQYGHAESIQSLQHRITSKRDNLMKMRELVIESQNSYGDNQQIKEMFEKRQIQLKQLLKLRLDMSYDEMKQCGCKEQDKIKLKADYSHTQAKVNQIIKEAESIYTNIVSLELQIKGIEKLRQRLLNQYKDETEQLINRDFSHPDLNIKLEALKQQIQGLNQKISGYSRRFNSLQFQCNQYKDKLANRLLQVDEVISCMGKKDYYEKLKSKANQILYTKDHSALDQKRDIIRSLTSIKNQPLNLLAYHLIDMKVIKTTILLTEQVERKIKIMNTEESVKNQHKLTTQVHQLEETQIIEDLGNYTEEKQKEEASTQNASGEKIDINQEKMITYKQQQVQVEVNEEQEVGSDKQKQKKLIQQQQSNQINEQGQQVQQVEQVQEIEQVYANEQGQQEYQIEQVQEIQYIQVQVEEQGEYQVEEVQEIEVYEQE